MPETKEKIDHITVTAEASLCGQVIFQAEEQCPDDEHGFNDARYDMIDRIEDALVFDSFEVRDRLVDGWDVNLTIFDEDGEIVGEGFIRA